MSNYKLDKIISVRSNKTIYRDGDKVIKLLNEEYSAPHVLSEALILAAVDETQLKVPKLIEVTKINGKWAIVWEYVEGTPLDHLMEANKGKEDEYLERFVDIQLDMHEHKASWLQFLPEKMERKIKSSELDGTARYQLLGRLSGMQKKAHLCHGDFNPSNVIITNDGEACIIDWSHATQGNRLADVAQTYLLFRLAGDINMADKYLTLLCKKLDTPERFVQVWLSLVAASHLPRAKPEEKELLLTWANVTE